MSGSSPPAKRMELSVEIKDGDVLPRSKGVDIGLHSDLKHSDSEFIIRDIDSSKEQSRAKGHGCPEKESPVFNFDTSPFDPWDDFRESSGGNGSKDVGDLDRAKLWGIDPVLRSHLFLDDTDSSWARFVDKGEDEASDIRLFPLDKGYGVEVSVLSVLDKGDRLDKRLLLLDKGEGVEVPVRLLLLDKGEGVEIHVRLLLLDKGEGVEIHVWLLLLDEECESWEIEARDLGSLGDFILLVPILLLFEPYSSDSDIQLLFLINGEGVPLGEAAPCEEELEPVDFGVAVSNLLQLPNFTL